VTTLFFGPGGNTAHGGGLRAGHYRIDAGGTAELSGVVYVPGVTVTGRIERFLERRESGRLRIGGRAAPHGVLRLEGLRITGHLGGRRVRGDLSSPVAVVARAGRLADLPLPRLREMARRQWLF
jgi:hypothetical protein